MSVLSPLDEKEGDNNGLTTSACPFIGDQRLRDPWHHVLKYLPTKELFVLSLVCKSFYLDVEDFCRGVCNKLSLDSRIITTFQKQLMLKQDRRDVVKIRSKNFTFKWLLTTWRKIRRLHRSSVSTFAMDNLGNPSFIIRKYDDALRREVVMFSTVVWLQFIRTFTKVVPGQYLAVIRICNHDAPLRLRLYWEDSDGYHERVTEVKSYTWRGLGTKLRHRKGKPVRVNKEEGSFVANYDYRYGWFDFCFAKIELFDVADVTFEYSDVCDDWWKGGMQCDYAELRPTNWISEV